MDSDAIYENKWLSLFETFKRVSNLLGCCMPLDLFRELRENNG